jgi:hypothetical protein
MPYTGYEVPKGVDYALIDFLDPFTVALFSDRDSDLRARKFLEEGELGVVDSFDSVVLFKKGYAGNRRLFEAGVTGYEGHERIFNAGDKMALLWYEAVPEGRFLNIRLCWETLGEIKDDIWMAFYAVDSGGKQISVKMNRACFGLYPTYRWKKGEKVIDTFKMLLPEGSPQPLAYLGLSLFSGLTDKRISLTSVSGVNSGKSADIIYLELGTGEDEPR